MAHSATLALGVALRGQSHSRDEADAKLKTQIQTAGPTGQLHGVKYCFTMQSHEQLVVVKSCFVMHCRKIEFVEGESVLPVTESGDSSSLDRKGREVSCLANDQRAPIGVVERVGCG